MQENESLELAIVILNFNGKNWLEKFLPTVILYSPKNTVIVADNCSTDDSVNYLKSNFPEVQLIHNEENGGFAKGYNDALKKVKATYYLLLNSDIEVTENWLSPLLKKMETEGIAGCQPKVLAYNNKEKFEHAGASGGFIDRLAYPFCRGRILNHVEIDAEQYNYSTKIFWATGACMLVKSSVYWELEGLDERFFAHMEEIDFCWKANRAGYHFEVVPESTVYHVGGGTLAYESPKKTFLNFRNSLLMIHKNNSGIVFLVIIRRLLLDGLAGIFFLLNGKFPHVLAVLKAHFSYYSMISSSQKERKKWRKLTHKPTNGVYNGSILWVYFAQKVKVFSQLNARRISK